MLVQGSHYYFEGVKLAQGRENVLLHLKENPDTAARLTTAVKAKMAEVRQSGAAKLSTKRPLGSSFEDDDLDLESMDDETLLQELAKKSQSFEDS